MPTAVDVLVVGAGPAGAAAGLAARRRGLDVLVVDKASFPRDKTCGDGLTTAALRLIEQLGVDLRTLPGYMAVRETVLVGPDGRRVSLPLATAGSTRARHVARLPAVLPWRRRSPALRALRGRPAPRVRLGVPASRRSRERRVRRASPSGHVRQGAQRALAGAARAPERADGARAGRRARGDAPRVADPGVVRVRREIG